MSQANVLYVNFAPSVRSLPAFTVSAWRQCVRGKNLPEAGHRMAEPACGGSIRGFVCAVRGVS